MGKILGTVAKAAGSIVSPITSTLTGGQLGDDLFGKEDPGTAASMVNIYNPEQQGLLNKATSQYGKALENNTQNTQNQATQMENQVRQNAEDNTRQASQLVAQRGLGSSSVGINSILNQKADVSDKIGAIHAAQPGMELDNLNKLNTGIGNLLGTQSQGTIYNKAVASQGRLGGGLAPLLVAGGKAYASGGAA